MANFQITMTGKYHNYWDPPHFFDDTKFLFLKLNNFLNVFFSGQSQRPFA